MFGAKELGHPHHARLVHAGVSGIEVGLAELDHLRLAIEAAEAGPLPDDLMAALDHLADTNFT